MNTNRLNNLESGGGCKVFASRLNEYIDGTLDSDLTWRIQNHLVVCSSCMAAVTSLTKVTQLLRNTERREVSASFDAALRVRIAAVSRKPAQPVWSFILQPMRWSAPIAALAACLVFAVLFMHAPIVPTANTPISNVPSVTAVDAALIQTCLNQHRTESASDPMSDTSAQLLTASVDNLPVDQSQSHKLSDDDAAVLLDEEM